jgi:hypothetical protein
VRCGTTQTAFFCSVGAVGILAVLEVETDLVETLFGYKVVVLAEVSAVDYGVYEFAWVGF